MGGSYTMNTTKNVFFGRVLVLFFVFTFIGCVEESPVTQPEDLSTLNDNGSSEIPVKDNPFVWGIKMPNGVFHDVVKDTNGHVYSVGERSDPDNSAETLRAAVRLDPNGNEIPWAKDSVKCKYGSARGVLLKGDFAYTTGVTVVAGESVLPAHKKFTRNLVLLSGRN